MIQFPDLRCILYFSLIFLFHFSIRRFTRLIMKTCTLPIRLRICRFYISRDVPKLPFWKNFCHFKKASNKGLQFLLF